MHENLPLHEFLAAPGVILDVRSPSEYAHGRIPGAYNLPLFSDQERAEVGTVYKQIGRREAIELGLKIVGPKLFDFVNTARSYAANGPVKVHCWRGGMRSSSMAWLLRTAEMKTLTLSGGYKTFRRWALNVIKTPLQINVIGGLTGSGKTSILHALKENGEQVLDLEAIANHRGSSFGVISKQPSNEQFVNELAVRWACFDPKRPVWIEDESRMIGQCFLPEEIFRQMRSAPVYMIERSQSERIENLLKEYGKIDPEVLINASKRLTKRLGSQRAKTVVEAIQSGNLIEAIELVLQYYDSTYHYGIGKRVQVQPITCSGLSHREVAEMLIRRNQ